MRHRRGMAAVVAMIYLCLFATLAVGFYASVTISTQISENERSAANALRAAESGIQFARLQLADVDIEGSSNPSVVLDRLYVALNDKLSGTGNMGGEEPTPGTDAQGNDVIEIPGNGAWMNLPDGAGQARITVRVIPDPDTAGQCELVVRARGRSDSGSEAVRAIEMTGEPVPFNRPWTSFGSGLLSRGPVRTTNGTEIDGGDVVSVTAQNVPPLDMSGGSKIRHDFYYTNNRAPVLNNGARVDGSIIKLDAAPVLPTADTSIFAQYVPSASAPAGPKVITASTNLASNAVLTNVRVKANANTAFGNSVQLNGVIYIESPNRVSFGGGVRINGIIVTDGGTATTASGNKITIDNGCRVHGLETLNPSGFPASERIGELTQMGNALVIAPNFHLELAGGSRTYDGTIAADSIDISNGYRGTIGGNMLVLKDTLFSMMGGGRVQFTAPRGTVTGLYTSGVNYRLNPTTYEEVKE